MSGDESVLSGWLKKKGDKGLIKGWKNRWFQEKEDGKIYYYKVRDDAEHMGFIEIAKINKIAKTNLGAFGFSITVATGRVYILQAFTESDRQEWLRVLKAKTNLTILDEDHVE